MVDLLGGLAVQRPDYVFGFIGSRCNKAVIPHLVVDIFLVGLHPAAAVFDQGIGYRVFIDLTVGGNSAPVPCSTHQGDAQGP